MKYFHIIGLCLDSRKIVDKIVEIAAKFPITIVQRDIKLILHK